MLKKFSPKNGGKMALLTQNTSQLCSNVDKIFVFKNDVNFIHRKLAENKYHNIDPEVLKSKLLFLWPIPLFLLSTHKQCILSHLYTTALLCFLENLIPWWDSNPVFSFLRRMRSPLRHAARAMGQI
jgi:hypothetical protein